MVPWVHYVPLSFSGVDLIEKVEWLRRHDHLAQRLAENAKNFGKSFLRVEDYLCYAGAALTLVAHLEAGSNITGTGTATLSTT